MPGSLKTPFDRMFPFKQQHVLWCLHVLIKERMFCLHLSVCRMFWVVSVHMYTVCCGLLCLCTLTGHNVSFSLCFRSLRIKEPWWAVQTPILTVRYAVTFIDVPFFCLILRLLLPISVCPCRLSEAESPRMLFCRLRRIRCSLRPSGMLFFFFFRLE